MVEHLLSMGKALGLISNTLKKNTRTNYMCVYTHPTYISETEM
jgi:hypothetical protein